MSKTKPLGLTRRHSGLMALEPRFMFDGAAVDVAHDQLVDAAPPADSTPPASAALFSVHASASEVASAAQLAQQQVQQFLSRATPEQIFEIFNGGQSAPDRQWVERLADLQKSLADGSLVVQVVAMDRASQFTAMAAFTPQGPNGQPTIFINPYWVGMFDDADVVRILVEEMGHAIDAQLNPSADTPGDEGEAFADRVIDGELSLAQSVFLRTEKDDGTVTVDGVTYAVEFASLRFQNAYHMVYDWDTQNNSEDVTERWASKEQNLHYFNATGLGAVSISDGSNGINFSGNDVSALALTVGGQTHYGWISRPIKSNGIVRGFYFWTDSSFSTLALAQADGNQDGDSSVADNRGFVLVVDQTWFTQQISGTAISKTFTSASKDVIDGYVTANTTLTIANVGSSSDRVDSALNSVVSSNAAPVAVSDLASGTPSLTASTGQGNAALEQGYNTNTSSVITASIAGSGNVLANDSDSNTDPLSVTTVTSKLSGLSATANAAGVNVVGKYGTLLIKSDGSWTYTPDNTNSTVNALRTGNLQEEFTYTASDGKGGTATATLTVQINGSNDAPVASNDYGAAKEALTDGAGNTTYAGYTASGNVLPNDSDVDTGDTKTIAGSSTSGSATGTTQSNSNLSATVLTFDTLSSSIKIGAFVFYDGGQTLDNNNGTGTTNLKAGTANITVSSIDVVNKRVTLSGVVTNYTTAQLGAGTVLGFGNNSNGNGFYKDAAISGSLSQTTSVVNLSSVNGTVAIGMTVSGGGLPAGTKITNVTFDTNGNPTAVTISSTTAVSGASLTFSGSGSAGQTIAGKYGSLVLNADGSYVYTPYADNPAIDNGDAVLETFTYTMQDAAGVTSTANLLINVYGSSTTDPVMTVDNATAFESGVGRSSSSPYNSTGDNTAFSGVNVSVTGTGVLSNDTSITGYAVNSYTNADGTGTTSAGSNLVGLYGTLNIASTGSYTYTVANGNSTVNALLPGATLTETFRYKITNGSLFAWSTLTVTIQGTNDLPVAVADTGDSLTEDVSLRSTGNVLTNDTDVDAGDTRSVSRAGTASATTTVTAGTTSANGLVLGGTYGSLTIGADGTYAYVLATASDATRFAALQALAANQQVQEVFYYEVKDANGATASTTLTFSITGTNEPPVNNYPTSVTISSGSSVAFTGSDLISVTDADGNLNSVRLHVDNGVLTSTTTISGYTVTGAGTTDVVITGTQSQINAYLANLTYTANGGFTGTDYLTIFSRDASNAYDSDGLPISIPTTFVGPTVLESDLASGSNASGTGETATAQLTAPTGQNFGPTTQSGTDAFGTWTLTSGGLFSYTLTGAPTVSGANSTRPVSVTTYDQYGNATTNTVTVTITDDAPLANADTKIVNEGTSASGNVLTNGTPDKFGADGAKITSPVGGVVGVRSSLVGSPSVTDTTTPVTTSADGITQVNGAYGYLVMNKDGSYTYTATASITTTVTDTFVYTIEDKDGDRSTTTLTITVNDASTPTLAVTGQGPVNEGSTYAVFTVTPGNSSNSASIDLSVSNGSATLTAPGGGAPFIQYSTDGTTWTTYGSSSKPVGGAVFYVRVNIVSESDSVYEGSESFSLVAAFTATPSVTDSASTSIVDDGTGAKYTGDVTSGSPVSNTTALDDDRQLTVNNITVNEGNGSNYAVFSVGTVAGQTLNLSLSDGTAVRTGSGDTLDFGSSLQYWNGSAWTAYSAGFTVPGTANANTTLLVRVQLNADTTFEGSENFTLTAAYANGGTKSATGTATVKDDGTGTKFTGGNPSSNDPSTITESTSLDDDRQLTVNNITVNEGNGSNYAVFSVGTVAGQTLNLSLTDGTAVRTGSGDTLDFGSSLQYWNGSAWTAYSAGFTVPGTANANTTLLVRVQLNADNTFEGSENFTLTAAYANGGTKSATGTATVKDDGTGTKFTGGNPSSNDPSTITDSNNLDDDRPGSITVTGGNYNENSPRTVFTVNASAGQVLTLDVQNAAQPGKAPTGDNEGKPNDSLDTAPIYYSLDGGATWQLYNGPITAGNVPVLVAVDISNERDNVYEGEEQLKLVVTSGGQTASGFSSIFDDGTGTVTANITPQTTNNAGANDPAVVKDDDRPAPALTPPAPPPAPSPSAPPVLLTPPPPLAPTVPSFASALTPLAPAIVPADPPGLSMIDAVTSGSGYQIPVSETAPPGLSLYQGITDQFVQTVGAMTKVSLPFDAFIHSNKDAVIKLEAKQVDNSNLPSWVQFDPATGVFEVTPPPSFKGKLDLKVVARDDDGREAVAIFQMFIGEQTQPRAQGRDSFSEKLRMAGKRPVTLVRVADASSARLMPREAPVRETVPMRVRAG